MKHRIETQNEKSRAKHMLHAPCSMLRGRAGQFLIEAIVAGSILIVGFSGIVALLSRALHSNRVVTSNYIGTYLAAEGIEIVKNIIDHNAMRIVGCTDTEICSPVITPCGSCNWDGHDGINVDINDGSWEVDYGSTSLLAATNRALLFDSSTGLYGYSPGSATEYRRTITILHNPPPDNNPREIQVVSTVTWSGGNIGLVDRFFNWRP